MEDSSLNPEPVQLLLFPGLDGTEVFFGPLLRRLPAWIHPRIITYPPAGPNGYADLLPLAESEVLAARKCHLMAWSFGGPLALMAAHHPEADVRGIILCASFIRPPRPELVRWRFAAKGPVIAVIRSLRRLRLLNQKATPGSLREAKAHTWRRVASKTLAERARAILALDCGSQLASFKRPILSVEFAQDEIVPSRNGDEMSRIAVDFNRTTLNGDHLAIFTNPMEVARNVVKFLSKSSNIATAGGQPLQALAD